MKSRYIFGAVALVTIGLAGMWGVNEYLSLKSQLEEIQSNAQINAQASPSQPVAPAPSSTPQMAPQSNSSPPVQINFDDLPLCGQLDAIANERKSVSQFIVNSGRYDEFAAQVTANCNWNAEQLKQADSILHPLVKQQSTSIG
jgi:hypothetical protein